MRHFLKKLKTAFTTCVVGICLFIAPALAAIFKVFVVVTSTAIGI
ncbi:putative membrane protein [Synechococcus sp. A15-24]|jgi:hypothetical protein|nr:putative membrane protein [Synechococcus sp. A15-24]